MELSVMVPGSILAPLEKGYHPEIDKSEELDEDGVKKYQTMIGYLKYGLFP
jgi:hypothetical protein